MAPTARLSVRRFGLALRQGLGALVCLTLVAGSARADMDARAYQQALAGTWVGGDGTTWVVDVRHLQVNMDPDRPFDWKALQLVNVSGHMAVFDVGNVRYIALLTTPDTLQVTSLSFPGEKLFHLAHR